MKINIGNIVFRSWRPHFVWAFLLVAVSFPNHLFSEEYNFTLSEIKAAHIVGVIDFVKWPNNSNQREVCVVGDEEVAASLLTQVTIDAQQYLSAKVKTYKDSFLNCDAVFITSLDDNKLEVVLSSLKNKPVLVMGDVHDFIDKGGMVGFSFSDNNVGIEINTGIAKQSKIKISSDLQIIADRVVSSQNSKVGDSVL